MSFCVAPKNLTKNLFTLGFSQFQCTFDDLDGTLLTEREESCQYPFLIRFEINVFSLYFYGFVHVVIFQVYTLIRTISEGILFL
ncbi:hypothetical protein D3C86_967830 [compost metagenome]